MSHFTGRLKRLVLSGKLARTSLTGAALKVLLVLSAHADRDGLVTMSRGAVAEYAGLAVSNVQTAIHQLLEADLLWLERRAAGRRPPTYRVITDRHISEDDLGLAAARSRPAPLSATASGRSVADLSTGQQDAVADLHAGQQVEKSPRARTETSLAELNTTTRLGPAPRWDEVEVQENPLTFIRAQGAQRPSTGERPAGEAAQGDVELGIRQQVLEATS